MRKFELRVHHRVIPGILFLLLLLCPVPVQAAGSQYDSPYVSVSPDGGAWTTCAGDPTVQNLPMGTVRYTGIPYRELTAGRGQHIYAYDRRGIIPVWKWYLNWPDARCIHQAHPEPGWHGLSFGTTNCRRNHLPGWLSYCADCGAEVVEMLFYMSDTAAGTLKYLESGSVYYYLCPFPSCRCMEQGGTVATHTCHGVSYNSYYIQYDPNDGGTGYGGEMPDSFHMYHNAKTHRGEPVNGAVRLSANHYTRPGYLFDHWEDAAGRSYGDQQEIYDLTELFGDTAVNTDGFTITLKAVWRRASGTLYIDPNGGTFAGHSGVFCVTMPYGTVYPLDQSRVSAPSGYRVSFQTNGGNAIMPITSAMRFKEWIQTAPFQGTYLASSNQYTFSGPDGACDRLTARYASEEILLPTPVRPGYAFGGWYRDSALVTLAGAAGDRFLPTGNLTLYAKWVELSLFAENNYSANGGRGAVNLTATQADHTPKVYKFYQSQDGQNWKLISDVSKQLGEVIVGETIPYTGAVSSYTVPSSGIYEFSVCGAQGSSYGTKPGGKGGLVRARFWLNRGEILTFQVGGQGQGGTGTVFGNGGDCTVVRKGAPSYETLIVAGGGGAATLANAGGAGGSAASVRGDSDRGESGAAGGGNGWYGGTAGYYRVHLHTASCAKYHTHKASCFRTERHEHDEATCPYIDRYYCGGLDRNGVRGWCPNCGCNEASGCTNIYGPGSCVRWSDFSICTGTDRTVQVCPYKEGEVERYLCGWNEGDVISRVPSGGGSSYVSGYALTVTEEAGARFGNGMISFTSVSTGYRDLATVRDVTATDLASPGAILEETVNFRPGAGGLLWVEWEPPVDNGTLYYHKAESFVQGNTAARCTSNITENTLISGIAGYYYKVDGLAFAQYTATNAASWKSTAYPGVDLTISLMNPTASNYLHLVPFDRAGNIGPVTDLLMDGNRVDWELFTDTLLIDDTVRGVCRAPGLTDNQRSLYYVKADGLTPFTLSYAAHMDGMASAGYQINYCLFSMLLDGAQTSVNAVYIPVTGNLSGNVSYTGENMRYISRNAAESLIGFRSYSRGQRFQNAKAITLTQQFVMSPAADNRRIFIYPGAGADRGDGRGIQYSDDTLDRRLGFYLQGDAMPPTLGGLETVEENADADILRNLTITAVDAASGVELLEADVFLEDGNILHFVSEDNATLQICISEEIALFGNVRLSVGARDRVSNLVTVERNLTGVGLETDITRILEPHDPVFKGGESGILHLVTHGGVERVEVWFPEELTNRNPSLNCCYDYTPEPGGRREEKDQFMVPLYTPGNREYEVIVRAFKGEKVLEQRPVFRVLDEEDNVLKELKTRLR